MSWLNTGGTPSIIKTFQFPMPERVIMGTIYSMLRINQ